MRKELQLKLSFASDTGVYPQGDNAREFLKFVRIGMNEMEAIETATVNAAASLGRSDEIGALAPGMLADIIATAGSPLMDISELTRIKFVMRAGKTYNR